MGKHNSFAHFMHLPKQMVFNQAKPDSQYLYRSSTSSPMPQMQLGKTNANNRYLGRGRGR